MEAEVRRAFLALWPPAALASALLERCAGLAGRPVPAQDLHLTLAYLGDLDDAGRDAVSRIAARLVLPALDLQPDRLAWWPHNRILWAGLKAWPEPLARFHSELLRSLMAAGFSLEKRPFVPHLTLLKQAARHSGGGMFSAGDVAGLPRWPLESFCLAASLPAGERLAGRYTILERWPAVQ
jgi:2'-5' RNA ligase